MRSTMDSIVKEFQEMKVTNMKLQATGLATPAKGEGMTDRGSIKDEWTI